MIPSSFPDGGAFYFCSVAAVRPILPRLHTFLNVDERVRLGSYRREPDRERFALGRALLRLFAGRILNAEPYAVSLHFTSTGKPVICSGGLHVNVSHSGDVVALAFADRAVGIDVEAIAEIVPLEAATIAFSPTERARLARLAGDERRQMFYEIWTRKEALLKADGRGLHDDLTSLETMRDDGSWRTSVSLGGATFAVTAIAAPPGAIAAAASSGCLGRIEPTVLTAEHVRILAARSFEGSRAASGRVRSPRSLPREAASWTTPAANAARCG